jgi:hypothetical protein
MRDEFESGFGVVRTAKAVVPGANFFVLVSLGKNKQQQEQLQQ